MYTIDRMNRLRAELFPKSKAYVPGDGRSNISILRSLDTAAGINTSGYVGARLAHLERHVFGGLPYAFWLGRDGV